MTHNNITGDALRTKPASDAYRENYLRIFGRTCKACGQRTAPDQIHTCSPQVKKEAKK
jgi:hypothetical protein